MCFFTVLLPVPIITIINLELQIGHINIPNYNYHVPAARLSILQMWL